MSTTTAGHVLVIGVDGVRFDLLGPDTTPFIWGIGQAGFLAPVLIDDATPSWSGPCWATIATAATGPGIHPGAPPLITRPEQVAPLVLAAVGLSPGQG